MSHTKKGKNLRKKGAKIPEKSDVLYFLSYLPPFSNFVLLSLTPLPPGHHLCTFPNANGRCSVKRSDCLEHLLPHRQNCAVSKVLLSTFDMIRFPRIWFVWIHLNQNCL